MTGRRESVVRVNGDERERAARASRAPRANGRGVAMMLVVAALAVGVIVAGAVIGARQVTPTVGANAESTLNAHWAAESAAHTAVAVMQTDFDWTATNGVVPVQNAVPGADIEATLRNLDGDEPRPGDRELVMTVRATVNGVTTTHQKQVSVTPRYVPDESGGGPSPWDITPDANGSWNPVDPFLGEFAVVATGRLQIADGATVKHWKTSPESATPRPVQFAAAFESSSDLDIHEDAEIERVRVFMDDRANVGMHSRVPSRAMGWQELGFELPAPSASSPDSFDALGYIDADLRLDSGLSVVAPMDMWIRKLVVTGGATLVLDETSGTLFRFDEIVIEKGGAIEVIGRVELLVEDELTVRDGGTIDVSNGQLTVFAGKDVELRSVVGVDVPRASFASLDRDDAVPFGNPRRLRFVGLDWDKVDFVIDQDAIVCGQIYAPGGKVEIKDRATFIGSLVSGCVRVDSDAALYYCPTLDSRLGFTNPVGPLYDPGTGQLLSAVRNAMADAQAKSVPWEDATVSLAASVTSGLSGLVSELVGGLLGPGGAGSVGGSGDGGPTPRSAARAMLRHLPVQAASAEGTTLIDGRIDPKSVVEAVDAADAAELDNATKEIVTPEVTIRITPGKGAEVSTNAPGTGDHDMDDDDDDGDDDDDDDDD